MYTIAIVVALAIFAFNFWAGLGAVSDRDGFECFRSPYLAVPMILASLIASLFVAVPLGHMGAVVVAGLNLPCGLVGAACIGTRLGDILSRGMSGVFGIRNLPSFDKAQAAEKRNDFAGAEALYTEFFEKNHTLKSPDEDLAEAHLAYGNLLQRMNRLPEAAEQWEWAASGNLLPERAQISARRASEQFLRNGDPRRAARVLRDAIRRHPREPVTVTLQRLLDNLPPVPDN